MISLEFQIPYFPSMYEIGFAQHISAFFILMKCKLQFKCLFSMWRWSFLTLLPLSVCTKAI